jgi:predicted nucleic acid-binding protein
VDANVAIKWILPEIYSQAALRLRHPNFPLMVHALETATRVDQAVYDCVYLSLAVKHSCQMMTADQRFYNALKRDPLYVHLCWIADLP